jgi:putative lipoic acid-binding regulatory protein
MSENGAEEARGLTFPGDHVLIAIGPPGEDFQRSLERVLIEAGGVRTAAPIASKQSRTGKYQSVHIELAIPSREELERLYAVLRAHPEVVYRL